MIRMNRSACWVLWVDTQEHECGEGIPHFASPDEAHEHAARCDACPVEALPREEDASCWTVHCYGCGEEMDPYSGHWPNRASALQSILDIGGVIVGGDEHYCPECACDKVGETA